MNGRIIKAVFGGITVSLILFGNALGQQLSPEDMKKVEEAIPYAILSDEIYKHKSDSDGQQGLTIGAWTRIDSDRTAITITHHVSTTANSTIAYSDVQNSPSPLSGSSGQNENQGNILSGGNQFPIQIPDALGATKTMTSKNPDPISFHAEVYKNDDGKRVIVFEGTDLKSIQDLQADFAQPLTVPAQYKAALEFTKKVIEGCSNDPSCNKNDIVVTGHSLGGGLAQYVAMSVEADVKAYTFNPAGLWDSTAESIDTGKAANITNFIADGYIYSDVVSKTGVVFGKKIPVAVSAVKVHSIDGLKNAMVELAGPRVEARSVVLKNELGLPPLDMRTANSTPAMSPALMQNQLTAITQGGSSHIGSAAYFMGRSPSQDFVRESRETIAHVPTVRETSQTTSGFIIQAPVDIVLTWGATPSDLDSHLTGPAAADGTRFHTYYAARGDLNAAPNVMLYRDVTTGAGPEQTRINVVQPGVYRFYVHDYTNLASVNSTALSNSGAVVAVHAAGNFNLPEGNNLGAEVARVSVPANQAGTVWQAFELDSRTGILNRVDQFRNVSDPASVPFNQ